MTPLQESMQIEHESRQHILRSGFWVRLTWTPFEVGLGLFAIYSGVSGLMHFGASNLLFQAAIKGSELYNIIFILAGVATIYGLGFLKANIEAFGLCCIISSLLVRMMAIIATTGWNQISHNLLAISFIFILASIIRIGGIINGVFIKRE